MGGKRTKIHNARLQEAVDEAEQNGKLKNQSVLWDTVAEIYNTKRILPWEPITASQVRVHCAKNQIGVKTQPGKRKNNLDPQLLQKLIGEIEQVAYPNRSALFQKVSELYQSRYQMTCHPSTLASFAKKSNLTVATPVGKQGRTGGFKSRGPRRSKSDRFAKSDQVQASLALMKQNIPPELRERYLPLAEQVARGSRAAAVKMHCLECSGWSTPEVRECCVTQCALWAFRPYQGSATPDEQGETLELEPAEIL